MSRSRRPGVACPPILAAISAVLVCAAAPATLAQSRAAITKPDQAPALDSAGRGTALSRPSAPQVPSDSADDGAEEADTAEPVPAIRPASPARPAGTTPSLPARRRFV